LGRICCLEVKGVYAPYVLQQLTRQDTLEEHYYKALTHGLHYQPLLSASTVLGIVETLLNVDGFDEYDLVNPFALELHLRCVIAALRALTLYGNYNCSRLLRFDLLDTMYNSFAKLAYRHSIQSQKGFRPRSSDFLEHYNNEFLIVYARDLVASLTWDRDLMLQAVARISDGIRGTVQTTV
jgi:hypothetical protein